MLALSRFWSAWRLLHPLTNRSSSCHRMAGACSAKVLIATADRRVISRPRVRQSAAPSRHHLLPARGARGACKWRVSAGRRCSDVAHSSPASASSVCDLEPRLGNQQRPSRHERPPTQTRPFGSVSALVAAVFGPAVGSAAPMSVAVNAADLHLHWQYVRAASVALALTSTHLQLQ